MAQKFDPRKWDDYRVRNLPLSKILVHPTAQRRLKMAHVKDIVDNFTMAAVQDIVVALFEGEHYASDGQHTKEVLRLMGRQYAQCRVVEVDSIEEMNALFETLNKCKWNQEHFDQIRMRADNVPGSPEGKMLEILKEYDLRVTPYGEHETSRDITALAVLRREFGKMRKPHEGLTLGLWSTIAGKGHRLDGATLSAVRQSVMLTHYDTRKLRALHSVVRKDWAQIRETAKSRCVNTTICKSPNTLTGVIMEHVNDEVDRTLL